MWIRGCDGSALVELTGGEVFTQRAEDAKGWGLFAIPSAGAPVILAAGSAGRVKEGLQAIAEAVRKGKHYFDLEEAIGPNTTIDVATAMPPEPAPGQLAVGR